MFAWLHTYGLYPLVGGLVHRLLKIMIMLLSLVCVVLTGWTQKFRNFWLSTLKGCISGLYWAILNFFFTIWLYDHLPSSEHSYFKYFNHQRYVQQAVFKCCFFCSVSPLAQVHDGNYLADCPTAYRFCENGFFLLFWLWDQKHFIYFGPSEALRRVKFLALSGESTIWPEATGPTSPGSIHRSFLTSPASLKASEQAKFCLFWFILATGCQTRPSKIQARSRVLPLAALTWAPVPGARPKFLSKSSWKGSLISWAG